MRSGKGARCRELISSGRRVLAARPFPKKMVLGEESVSGLRRGLAESKGAGNGEWVSLSHSTRGSDLV